MTRVLREVRRFVSALPVCREPAVVAVSGGADSVALLRALAACRTGVLTVAHVNHQLRGAESDADEAFVRNLAAELGLQCRVKSLDIAALGGNLESTARRVRYEFFAGLGAAWIATGHTADDQAETVLHRLVRGTGIQGLRGIARSQESNPSPTPPRRGEGLNLTPPSFLGKGVGGLGSSILRPLLTVTRADVLAHLAELGQAFREDSSNADPRFTRNRIRHELLPLLRTFNPDVVTSLARLAEHAAEAHEIIAEHATAVLATAERPRVGDTVILDVTDLGASRAVVRAALRLVWEREGWPMDQMDADAWDRTCDVAGRNVPAWDFPGGISARHTGRVVQIGPRK
ncbi:MAG: tRNA lysidine(34) synthetase TilS [Planctomycetes bacterium]|nr:tRNA lysidine(34) synthetase TilS [Planctomycetota bacterium]